MSDTLPAALVRLAHDYRQYDPADLLAVYHSCGQHLDLTRAYLELAVTLRRERPNVPRTFPPPASASAEAPKLATGPQPPQYGETLDLFAAAS